MDIVCYEIEVVFDEIKKGSQVGKSNPFCLGFSALGDLSHKIQNIIRRHLVEV
jgi:hypothetical protein